MFCRLPVFEFFTSSSKGLDPKGLKIVKASMPNISESKVKIIRIILVKSFYVAPLFNEQN